ncbi:MAG TPA: EscU/YscU/HrcU family type III secretion system export apparatus switch protein [Polyangiaceae bacterium]|jgi:flagellar biosynthetic protein FlhB|nr:EscU/YscU/HrcU family type III secretion system export apparatus switch protein [Polyangiaceae bacterium]
MSDDDTEKTEEASPERRRKAREEGQFPKAKDSGAVAATAAVLLLMLAFGAQLSGLLIEFITLCLRHPNWLLDGNLRALSQRFGTVILLSTLPLAAAAAVAAIFAGVLEGGFEPRFELAMPKWSRLDPSGKIGQMFSLKAIATNMGLTLGRVGLIGMIVFLIVKHSFLDLIKLARAPIEASTSELFHLNMRFATWATLAMVLMAALDYGVSWYKHEQSIKMSRQELKEEHLQQEGDPRRKAKQRQRAREIARGVAKRVRESDVVIANPTHIAIALRYRQAEGAPVVAAKGYDELALHIKKLAQEANIPVIENKPLARALAAQARVGKAIPVEFYAAVAEVLAFVYRARQLRRRA